MKLYDHLGVSLHRIILNPPPGTATVQDAVRLLHSPEKRACELIDGVLIERESDFLRSVFVSDVLYFLSEFEHRHDLGVFSGGRGGVQLWEGRIRFSDVLFFRYERFTNGLPKEPIPILTPDLAVEVLSESNTAREMELKRQDYFRSGTRLVWKIDPDSRTVEVFTSPDESTMLDADGILDGGGVLPGFTLPLRVLFAKLDHLG